jgi:hypothetical protein
MNSGSHNSLGRSILFVVALVVAAAGGLVALVGLRAAGPFSDAVASAPMPQSVDPCEHLGAMSVQNANYGNLINSSTAEFAGRAAAVARVDVVWVGEPLFNTPDGGPPTPLPDDASDEDEMNYTTGVFAPVVVTASLVYSGAQVTGYVINRLGGVSARCPGFEHRDLPNAFAAGVGDRGMVLLRPLPDEVMSDPPPAILRAIAVAEQLNAVPGVRYDVMSVVAWYRYIGGDAVLEILDRTLSVQQLEAEIEAATQP